MEESRKLAGKGRQWCKTTIQEGNSHRGWKVGFLGKIAPFGRWVESVKESKYEAPVSGQKVFCPKIIITTRGRTGL